ncbi:hypothetical protein SDJN02_23366, partial [Cucurbita argyrosperma subsp. argyrosperma]
MKNGVLKVAVPKVKEEERKDVKQIYCRVIEFKRRAGSRLRSPYMESLLMGNPIGRRGHLGMTQGV